MTVLWFYYNLELVISKFIIILYFVLIDDYILKMFSNTKAIINNSYLTQLTFYSLNKRRIILCKILFKIKKTVNV